MDENDRIIRPLVGNYVAAPAIPCGSKSGPGSYMEDSAKSADRARPGTGKVIEQVGALCVRRHSNGNCEVLLITTRQTGRWTIPKGWPVKGLEPHEVAELEAWEEAGVKGRAERRVFGYFTHMKGFEDGRKFPSVVEVHVMKVKRTKKKFPEAGQRKVAWLPVDKAAAMVSEPDLKSLLDRLPGCEAA